MFRSVKIFFSSKFSTEYWIRHRKDLREGRNIQHLLIFYFRIILSDDDADINRFLKFVQKKRSRLSGETLNSLTSAEKCLKVLFNSNFGNPSLKKKNEEKKNKLLQSIPPKQSSFIMYIIIRIKHSTIADVLNVH